MLRLLALLGLAALPATAETWTIGTEADYAPYIFHDESGELTGFDRELGEVICNRAAVDCLWVETDFDSLFKDLSRGRFDIVLAGIGETPDRRPLADFSTPYFASGPNAGVYVAMRPGISPDGALIGVQGGTTFAEWLAATGRAFRTYPTNEAALAALAKRDVDAVFVASAYYAHATETGWPQLRLIGSEEFPTAGTSVAVRKGAADILTRINAILDDLRADGTLAALEARWFRPGEPV